MSDDCHGCNTQLFNSDSSLTFDSLKNLKCVNGFGKFSMIKFSRGSENILKKRKVL